MSSPDGKGKQPGAGAPGRSYAGWWFLLIAVGVHLGVRAVDPALSGQSLDYFFRVLGRLAPAFGLMFLLLFLFNLLVRPERIRRWMAKSTGLGGWLFALLSGILSMGSMYLWYPLLKDLKAQGLRDSLLTAFLYSRAIKIPMLPFMAHYFGLLYTGLFVVHILLFSVLGGLLMQRLARPGARSE